MAGEERSVKVKIDGVRMVFNGRNGEMVALNGVDLDIHENEFVTVVGPSGCGKSTLMRILTGELEADGGSVHKSKELRIGYLAQVDDIDTMVFDEVDSGISGHAAGRVGTLMQGIADKRQVLCVTHLAQIAACGHSHLLVQKSVEDGRTYTSVKALSQQERIGELARIMGGEATDTTLSAARELYAAAQS